MSALKAGASGKRAQPHPEGARVLPEGTSFLPSATEVPQQRLKALEIELEQALEKLRLEREEHQFKQSNWRKQEAKLLQESRELRERLEAATVEIQVLKSQTESSPPLEGTPRLIIEQSSASEGQAMKFLQKLLPIFKSYKTRIAQLNEKIRRNQQKASHTKETKRHPQASADSAGANNQAGSSTLGFTLSLSSQQQQAEKYTHADSQISKAALDADRYPRYTDTNSDNPSALRFDRHGPVELSDHEYGNAMDFRRDQAAPQTLVSDSSVSTSASKRSLKPPVPMPRTRSLRTGTMRPLAESIESYEIVDRPAPSPIPSHLLPSRTLAKINEQSKQFSSSSSLSTGSDLPQRLSHRVVAVPHLSAETHQECDVCNTRYPQLSKDQFLDHCIECADRAAAEQQVLPHSIAVTDADIRICPLCQERFGHEVSQTDYENHVQSHFMEDETRAAGWESVTTD